MIDTKLTPILQAYAAKFDDIAPQEQYKWEAVQHFQKHWNLDAEDFPGMLERCLEPTANLLTARNYYPRGMINQLSRDAPEMMRTAFRLLLDESAPLAERLRDFRQYARELTDLVLAPEKADYQDPRACSVYLTLRYPERYGFFMFSVHKEAANQLGFEPSPKKGDLANLEHWTTMLREITAELHSGAHEDLLARHHARLTDGCYQSDRELILAQDVAYAIRNYLN